MIQRRQNFGFALEPADTIVVTGKFFGQDLDGDVAFEFRISRAIDLSHAAFAQQGRDLVGAELLTDFERHV